ISGIGFPAWKRMEEEPDVPETESRSAMEGLYLLEEPRPGLSYRLFARLLQEDRAGLVISRRHPARVKEEGALAARYVWLSHTPGEGMHNPTALAGLNRLIDGFLQENGRSVVLLDGLEYLMLHNEFARTLLFVEYLYDLVDQRDAIVLVPINPEAMDPRERALLERNLRVLQGGAVRRDLEREEWLRLLDDY
ncbi:MAG: DUF835 domain-containing protein, partial [Thermoplasmata archaeon]